VALLALEQVTAGYGQSPDILRGANLTLEPGEQVCVLSSNGAGKSTLLRVAAGLLTPRSGRVSFAGCANPAFIFQVPRQQLICATVREEIEYTLKLNGAQDSGLEQNTSSLLQRFGLTELSDRAPQTLSGGQQQKLVLAASLCREPALLLLDEPDSFLDGAARREFREFFFQNVNSAAIWTVCRKSEIPSDMKAFMLTDGKLEELL
jgi:energy-coupling factor transporter ATP-binding protein EcfA2